MPGPGCLLCPWNGVSTIKKLEQPSHSRNLKDISSVVSWTCWPCLNSKEIKGWGTIVAGTNKTNISNRPKITKDGIFDSPSNPQKTELIGESAWPTIASSTRPRKWNCFLGAMMALMTRRSLARNRPVVCWVCWWPGRNPKWPFKTGGWNVKLVHNLFWIWYKLSGYDQQCRNNHQGESTLETRGWTVGPDGCFWKLIGMGWKDGKSIPQSWFPQMVSRNQQIQY